MFHQENICFVSNTLKNQEFLLKIRALENSVQSMATFQEQFALFFTEKVRVVQFLLNTCFVIWN